MVSLDPEISILLWVLVLSEAPNGSGSPSTFANVLKKKWKTLDIQNGSKNRISNLTFFGINWLNKAVYKTYIASRRPISKSVTYIPMDGRTDGRTQSYRVTSSRLRMNITNSEWIRRRRGKRNKIGIEHMTITKQGCIITNRLTGPIFSWQTYYESPKIQWKNYRTNPSPLLCQCNPPSIALPCPYSSPLTFPHLFFTTLH